MGIGKRINGWMNGSMEASIFPNKALTQHLILFSDACLFNCYLMYGERKNSTTNVKQFAYI